MERTLCWYFHLTLTELKKDGISVTDSTTSSGTQNHSGRDSTVLVNLFEDKLDDMMEGYARGMNDLLYGDGMRMQMPLRVFVQSSWMTHQQLVQL